MFCFQHNNGVSRIAGSLRQGALQERDLVRARACAERDHGCKTNCFRVFACSEKIIVCFQNSIFFAFKLTIVSFDLQALFDKAPFKNVIVNGLVLAQDGKKMSKRLKNYPDPEIVVGLHGAGNPTNFLVESSFF
jgi:hypothetical protein